MARRRKVILAQPFGFNWVPGERDISRAVNVTPPVGILSLSAWLSARGASTRILDGFAHPAPLERWVEIVRDAAPDVLGVTATTSSFPAGARLAEAIRHACPDTFVVFGGVHASGLRERVLEDHPAIDALVVGEGEEALEAIVERGGRDLDDVPGVVWRRGSDVIANPPGRPRLDLDALPFPDYEKLEGFPRAYPLPIFSYPAAPTSAVVTSRGCPYACTYCDRSVYGRTFRYNSPRYMLEHLHHLRSRWGVRHVTFYDDIFTANRKRVEGFCDLMTTENPGVGFNCAVRSNQIDQDLVRRLAAAGCWQVSFGVESGDPIILGAHRKGTDLDDIRDKVALIKDSGMRVKGLFIVGLPGEDAQTIGRTIDYACSVPFDEVNVSKFTPFPGAPLYESVRETGTFDEDWERMNLVNTVYVPEGMTREELDELYRTFIRRFYERRSTGLAYLGLMLRHPVHLVHVLRHIGQFAPYLRWVRTGRR